jgi:hypothetical protein
MIATCPLISPLNYVTMVSGGQLTNPAHVFVTFVSKPASRISKHDSGAVLAVSLLIKSFVRLMAVQAHASGSDRCIHHGSHLIWVIGLPSSFFEHAPTCPQEMRSMAAHIRGGLRL